MKEYEIDIFSGDFMKRDVHEKEHSGYFTFSVS